MADAFTTYNPVIIYVPKNNDNFLNKYLLIAIFFFRIDIHPSENRKSHSPDFKISRMNGFSSILQLYRCYKRILKR